MAYGFIDGDLVGVAAAFDFACEYLPDLGDDMIVAVQAGLLGSEGTPLLPEDAFAAVGDKAGADDQVVVNFGRAGIAGTD